MKGRARRLAEYSDFSHPVDTADQRMHGMIGRMVGRTFVPHQTSPPAVHALDGRLGLRKPPACPEHPSLTYLRILQCSNIAHSYDPGRQVVSCAYVPVVPSCCAVLRCAGHTGLDWTGKVCAALSMDWYGRVSIGQGGRVCSRPGP